MNLIIWMCLVTWPSTLALYYTKRMEVFQPPTDRHLRNNSYFGYSITYDGLNKKLVISAPRENNIGEVYNCDIETRACTPIVKSVERVSQNYTHDYWFGATVKAGPDFVMMCAPRYTEYRNKTYLAYGKCYSYEKDVLKKKNTINEKIRNGELLKEASLKKGIEKVMDSFGWSIDVAPDDSTIVGGPGMFQGRAMIYNQHQQFPKLITSASVKTPKIKLNFGYAVASGTFINEDLSYAVGSPYGTFGEGKVSFYKGKRLQYQKKINGDTDSDQVGSMFGAVLCAASLYGDRTDLLVGAPTYASKNTYNLGAVFVYIARKVTSTPEFKRKIVGQVSGTMFGSAIVNVGDLNGDGKPEIAIGAPFEKNGHGVVYLYSGADLISELTERNLKCLQRIEPETSYSESFGLSLTTLVDYGENAYRGLAIGSPYKDTVVLLKCMAAVVVKISAKFPVLQGRTRSNKTDFEFEVCLSVKYPRLPEKITALVSTTVEMDHDNAKLVDTDGTGHVSFNTSLEEKKPQYCKNISFYLPLDGKYETKLSYTISSELQTDPKTLPDFDSSRVILSDRSDLMVHGSLWAAGCAGNKKCVPNLELTPVISFRHTDGNSYIIGSSLNETMHLIVHNHGEVAYDPCVRVHIDGANVLKTPTGCVYESSANRLKCEPSKPLQSNKTWTTGQIELEMTHLTNVDQTITINMHLYNDCEDVVTQEISIPIPVKADPGSIVAKGETDIGNIVNMTVEDIQQYGKQMQHVYTITNKGPTNWKEFQVQVTLQKQPYIDYGDIPVRLYFSTSNLPIPCPSVSKDETSKSFVCKVNSLTTTATKEVEFAMIVIPMYILPGTLDGMLDEDKNVTITSAIKLQLNDDDYKVESITTTITLLDATVPIKWIVIAVLVALCIISILAVVLYKVGFLRRKNREELEGLKSKIKHHSILRRSMMPKQPAEDRNQILEEMEEE